MLFERRAYTLRTGCEDAFWELQRTWNTPKSFRPLLERNTATSPRPLGPPNVSFTCIAGIVTMMASGGSQRLGPRSELNTSSRLANSSCARKTPISIERPSPSFVRYGVTRATGCPAGPPLPASATHPNSRSLSAFSTFFRAGCLPTGRVFAS